jgi:Ca2+/Na+ antiporter
MKIQDFFTRQYLFDINSAFISPAQKLMLFGGAVLVLVAVALKIAARVAPTQVDSKYRSKFYNLFLTTGLLSLFWYLCRFENVMFFGSRFVAFSILLIGIIWLVAILVSMIKKYGMEKQTYEKEQVKLKYLPK